MACRKEGPLGGPVKDVLFWGPITRLAALGVGLQFVTRAIAP